MRCALVGACPTLVINGDSREARISRWAVSRWLYDWFGASEPDIASITGLRHVSAAHRALTQTIPVTPLPGMSVDHRIRMVTVFGAIPAIIGARLANFPLLEDAAVATREQVDIAVHHTLHPDYRDSWARAIQEREGAPS